jgi:hypothetical protein
MDLGRLDKVSVDPVAGTIACGAGARVWQAHEAAARHGLALPLGTCGDVGVSGLTLGGGVGYLMGVAGAACDALIGADVILADGRRLMVTDRSDSDLMWALRGAGANFAIVTRLVYRAVRLRSVLAGTLSFPASAARDLLGLANNLSGVLPDELSVFTAVAVPPRGEPHVSLGVCWSGEAARGRSVIQNLVTRVVAPSAQTLRETTLAEFVGRDNPGGGMSCARYGLARRPLPDSELDLLLDGGAPPPAVRLVFLDPIHGAVTRVPSDGTAFPRVRRGAGAGFILVWNDSRLTPALRSWADQVWGQIEPSMSDAYVNMLDDEGEARVREAYGANYARLQRLKRRYDPDNVFRSNQNIPPAGGKIVHDAGALEVNKGSKVAAPFRAHGEGAPHVGRRSGESSPQQGGVDRRGGDGRGGRVRRLAVVCVAASRRRACGDVARSGGPGGKRGARCFASDARGRCGGCGPAHPRRQRPARAGLARRSAGARAGGAVCGAAEHRAAHRRHDR